MSNDLKIDPYIQEVEGQSFQIKAVSNQGVGVQWIRCVVSKLVFCTFAYATNAQVYFFLLTSKTIVIWFHALVLPHLHSNLQRAQESNGEHGRFHWYPSHWLPWMFIVVSAASFPLVWKETLTTGFRPPNMPVLLSSAGDMTEYSSVPRGPLPHSYFSGISLPTGPSLYSSSLH